MFDSIKRQPLFQITNNFIQIKRRARQLKQEDHVFQKMRKKMLKFSPENIHALQKAYLPKHEKKFNKKMHTKIILFHRELLVFFKMYGQIFNDLKEIVKLDERQEYTELVSVGLIIEAVARKNKPLIFPPDTVREFEYELDAFIKEMARFFKRDMRDDKRLSYGIQPKVGFFTRHRHDRALERDIVRLDKKLMRKYPKMKSIGDRLKAEAESGRIEQDFLDLFIYYLKIEGKFEVFLERIRNDLKELIIKHVIEHHECFNVVYNFSKLAKNYAEWRVPREIEREMMNAVDQYNLSKEDLAPVFDYVNADYRNQYSLRKLIVMDNNLAKVMKGLLDRGQNELRKPGA